MSSKASNPTPPRIVPSPLSAGPAGSALLQSLSPDPLNHTVSPKDLDAVHAFWRTACFIAAAQIFVADNALQLQRPLEKQDVKPRLLGHWGTTGGLALAYAHASALLARHERDEQNTHDNRRFLFVTGPGHGAPAILSTLYLEGSISYFYPRYPRTLSGLNAFIRAFSWPGGFPSHVNGQTPGAIHEGGELGYALAVAFGAIMDKPDLVAVTVVGDGESETGPTAAAWHAHKFIDPKESGAVLPILHVNGFKISERTLPGTADDLELMLLYSGYGWQPRLVEYVADEGRIPSTGGNDPADKKLNEEMASAMEWAYSEIRKIQEAARSDKPLAKPRWPMLILRSPKGWTGPNFDGSGTQMLNSFRSHQIPLPKSATDTTELSDLSDWLKSYDASTFFSVSDESSPLVRPETLTGVVPQSEERRMGLIREARAEREELKLGDWKAIGYKKGVHEGAMQAIGKYLTDVISKNPKSFRIFSPDELESNKLSEVFKVTHRDFQWDPETANDGGRVIEMLSEHTLQGFMQGYTLTGRTAIFPSYESFLGIIATMLVQYGKFLSTTRGVTWRPPVASITYIETSTWTRQEHNGFSHQSPSFISSVLHLPVAMARVYFPADANTALSVADHCLRSNGYCNLIVGSKHPTAVFLSVDEAESHCLAGASVWENYSTDNGADPDVVLVGVGYELTFEVIAAAKLLKKDLGDTLRVRVVNVVDLLIFNPDHPHGLTESAFNSLFPPKTPVIFNYHGYPNQLAGLLFARPYSVGRTRFHISGYSEQGTTTTPFQMMVVNGCGRFDVAAKALEYVVYNFTVTGNIKEGSRRERLGKVVSKAHVLGSGYLHQNVLATEYAEETQQDPPYLSEL